MKITWEGGSEHSYRSQLEREVADELTRLGVTYRYEVSVTLPGLRVVPYLPDFTIDAAPDDLRLPGWVECKPQQMLYELRDLTGVTRRVGEYFKDDVTVEGVSAADLMDREQKELAKPKRLAELSGQPVLVVGNVQATSSLSALLTPDGVVFSRSHPFVNQRGIARERERAARDEARESAYQEQMAEYRKREEQRRLEQAALREANVRQFVLTLPPMSPKFASPCYGCGQRGTDGGIYRVRYSDGSERWERVCATCQSRAKAGA